MEETKEFQERVGRIEGLLQKLDSSADPALRRAGRELVEALMELHGAALERILETAANAGETGIALTQTLAADPLVSSLLVLYGLHPEDFETRVRRGLERARVVLHREGAHWENLSIDGLAVRLRLVGARNATDARRLDQAVREALLETAPDATAVVISGGAMDAGAALGFVPLIHVQAADGSPIVVASSLEAAQLTEP